MDSGQMFQNHRLFVRELLNNPYAGQWTVQGLGMMRLYLSDEVRLHVWHSSLIVPNVTSVHDHPWNFESLVISGGLQNLEYIRSSEGKGQAFYEDTLLCGTGNLAGDPSPAWLETWHRDGTPRTYRPGTTYSQRFDKIHETFFEDGTATLVRRTFVNEDRDHAHVFWPRGGQFVSAEPRLATHDEITRIVTDALKLLGAP